MSLNTKKTGATQRNVYLKGDLNAKVNVWLIAHPHLGFSEFVREAIFYYLERERERDHVDIVNSFL